MWFQKVTHVLFDMDGLLLNTEDLYTICFQNITSQYGKNFTFDLKCKIMGQQSRDFAKTIIDDLELPISIDEFLDQSKAIFEELFKETKLMPGAERLIRHLHKHNIPIGLATSSSIESYRAKSANHKELFDLMPFKTWGSSDPEVKRGKPYPDTFLVAASRFPDKPAPEKVLVFEDSPNGVRSGRSAGMQVVMVPDPRYDRAIAPDPTLILDSLDQFQPELFGLPAFDDSA